MKLNLSLAFVSVALVGCTYTPKLSRLPPGQATEVEVIAAAGTPDRRWPNPDGGVTLEYSSQPLGINCYMVTLDASGRLVSVEDTLELDGRLRIQPGMTPEQVLRVLGRERTVVYFPLSREQVWDWNIDNSEGPGIATLFNVHFRDGVVVRTSQTYEFERDGGFGL